MFALDYSILMLIAIGVAAILYSSVGHGGASGYLAAMALFGLEPSIMKPAALTMNIFVTILVIWRSHMWFKFDWRLIIPLMAASLPLAYMGGALTIESTLYMTIVGFLLLLAALRLFWPSIEVETIKQPNIWLVILVGGTLGFISGLTGVGGGIYLSPLLLLFNWSTIKGSIPIVAAFILINSIAALTGYLLATSETPVGIPLLVVVAVFGAIIGTELAKRKLASNGLKAILGIVLIIAGFKMILTA